MNLKKIGMFKEIDATESISIQDLISDEPIAGKSKVLSYLKSRPVSAAAPAVLIDVITGESIQSALTSHNDGVYWWRSDVIYYFEEYNLKLPDEFIEHVLH